MEGTYGSRSHEHRPAAARRRGAAARQKSVPVGTHMCAIEAPCRRVGATFDACGVVQGIIEDASSTHKRPRRSRVCRLSYPMWQLPADFVVLVRGGIVRESA